jgi:nicotinate-nucleotide pyrophosphorylase (carboxylating)
MIEPYNDLDLDQLFAQLVDGPKLDQLIATARDEDLRDAGDITSNLTVPAATIATGRLAARGRGVLAGAALLPKIAAAYDPAITVTPAMVDGQVMRPESVIATVSGPLRSLLGAERILLNFLTHLSGVATVTALYVNQVRGTKAKIYDTRKTIPGLRHLAKYAVRCGGGYCHRIGLFDAVLIKDNHLAGIAGEDWLEKLKQAIDAARASEPAPQFIEVEVDTLTQLTGVLGCDVDVVLLDNMAPPLLEEAVELRNELSPDVLLEASGGITMQSLKPAADTGVDRIAIGAVTHSAPSVDIGFDIDPVR